MHALKKREMELITVVTLLCIFFSALLPPSASFQIQFQPSLHHQADPHQELVYFSMLPRKLRFTEKVKVYDEARDLAPHKQKDSLSGKQKHSKQKMVAGSKGTRQEWMERDDPSQYFTMDYTRVRRRRPIHNKHFPLGP